MSGKISMMHPDALGPADVPPGTFHPDRWPLWWKFSAPTDRRFAIQRTWIATHSYTDLRGEFFTLTGRVQVRHPDRETVAATFSQEITRANGPSEWLLRPGDTVWIRASSPHFLFEWSWGDE